MTIRIYIVALLVLLVAACDGSGSSTAPVNTAPTISEIPDQSTGANVTGTAISFAVTNFASTTTGGLTYEVSSDNQQVIADSGLDLVSNDAGGSITVTPVVDKVGDAFITIIVTDPAGLAASTSFLLTVVPQQLSMQQFVRTEFARAEAGTPELINAVAFDQDAENDDFADLLAQ